MRWTTEPVESLLAPGDVPLYQWQITTGKCCAKFGLHAVGMLKMLPVTRLTLVHYANFISELAPTYMGRLGLYFMAENSDLGDLPCYDVAGYGTSCERSFEQGLSSWRIIIGQGRRRNSWKESLFEIYYIARLALVCSFWVRPCVQKKTLKLWEPSKVNRS